MRIVAGLGFGISALALAYAAPAASQRALGQGVRVPRQAEPIRNIEFTLNASATYDSNIIRADKERAALRGLEKEDVRFSPTLGANVFVPFGRNSAYLRGSAGYNVHARNSSLDSELIDLSGGVTTRFGVCDLSTDLAAYRARTDLGDVGATGPDPLPDYRNIETVLSATETASCGGAIGLRPIVQIGVSKGNNSNGVREGSDYDTVNYGGGVIYNQPSIGQIGLLASIEKTDFDNRGPGQFPGIDDFKIRSLGIYYRRNSTRKFQGRVRVNYTDVDSGDGVRAFSGLTGEASVRLSPGGPFAIEFGLTRAATPTLAYDVDYFVETLAQVEASMRLAERLEFAARYHFRTRKYYATNPRLFAPLTDDDHHQVSAVLTSRRSNRLAVGVASYYEDRNANGTFYDYDSFRAQAFVRVYI